MLNDSDYGNFRIECESIHKEKDWTTKELFDYFNIDSKSDHFNTTQLEATHIIFKKNDHTDNYLNEYKKLLNEDPYLITDSYNSKTQIDSFKENRTRNDRYPRRGSSIQTRRDGDLTRSPDWVSLT